MNNSFGIPETEVEQQALAESLRQTQGAVCDKLHAHYNIHVLPAHFTLRQAITPRYVRFPLSLTEGEKYVNLARRTHEIAIMAGRPSCLVYIEDGVIWVAFPRRDARTVNLIDYIAHLPRSAQGTIPLALGVDTNGTPLLIDMASPKNPHVLITGVTGSGKTMCQWAMATSVMALAHPRYAALVFCDVKGSQFSELAPKLVDGVKHYQHVYHPALTDIKEMVRYLHWLNELMDKREHLEAGHRLPHVLVFIDELADLLSYGGAAAMMYVKRILERGRSAGIHIIAATNSAGRESIGELGGKFKFRVTLSQTRISDSIVATTQGGAQAHRLDSGGDMLVGPHNVRAQGFYVSRLDAQRMLSGAETPKMRLVGPWERQKAVADKAAEQIAINAVAPQPVVGRPPAAFTDDEIAAVVAHRVANDAWPSATAISQGRVNGVQKMGIPRAKRLLENAQEHDANQF